MAQKIEVLLIDDLDGGPANETVAFSLDGSSYEIDLSSENAKLLRERFADYIDNARKQKNSQGQRVAKRGRAVGSRERSADIRAWAKARGMQVNDRGRIPQTVVEQYEAAN